MVATRRFADDRLDQYQHRGSRVVPGWFTQTAGRTVTSMHDDIVRRKAGAANPNAWPDYEI